MRALELKVPPPVVAALTGAGMWLLARALPGLTHAVPGRRALAILLFALGAGVVLAGLLAFRKAGTTVSPFEPESSSALVVSGIYRITRNPMYLGLLLILLGWAALLSNVAALLFAVLFVVYITRFQIVPEERALRAKFGADYEAYLRTVRRWM